MISEEEKQQIIDAAVEKASLKLPEVVGNLMMQQATYSKLNSKFYSDHPEFRDHKDVVMATIEWVDGHNPMLGYKEKLDKAVPEIKRRIEMKTKLSMDAPKKPEMARYDAPLEAKRPFTDHGEI